MWFVRQFLMWRTTCSTPSSCCGSGRCVCRPSCRSRTATPRGGRAHDLVLKSTVLRWVALVERRAEHGDGPATSCDGSAVRDRERVSLAGDVPASGCSHLRSVPGVHRQFEHCDRLAHRLVQPLGLPAPSIAMSGTVCSSSSAVFTVRSLNTRLLASHRFGGHGPDMSSPT